MTEADWTSLLTQFEVLGEITYPPDACRQLARYESELGKLLPTSYKGYCSVFGPGELVSPCNYRISAPGPSSWTTPVEARRLHEEGTETNFEWRHYVTKVTDVTAMENALFFCRDISAYFYFWNTAEQTSPVANEYAIYVIDRTPHVYRLCDTFAEFVTDICMRKGIPGDSPSTVREPVFTPEPFKGQPPPTSFPPEWRTSTVLALAGGIQDDQAFDLMPILADALEEAGCDNAELLGHCRSESTHVRGCWVVDLVLGKE